jgi:hypothetical protein
VIQGREELRFTLESAYTIGITRKLIGKNFNRHLTLEPGVARTINLAHPAFAEKSNYFV